MCTEVDVEKQECSQFLEAESEGQAEHVEECVNVERVGEEVFLIQLKISVKKHLALLVQSLLFQLA